MTTSSVNTNARWSYTGDGATTVFVYDNKIFTTGDLEVYVDSVLQTLITHYAVSGAATEAGGNVTFVAAPAAAAQVVIIRAVAAKQESHYVDGDTFPAVVVENDFDRAIIILQQNIAEQDRMIGLAATSIETYSLDLPAAPTPAQFLTIDAVAGIGIDTGATGPVGATGPTGPTGATGGIGPQGPAGNMDGANNLSDVASAPASLANIGGLGTAGDGSALTFPSGLTVSGAVANQASITQTGAGNNVARFSATNAAFTATCMQPFLTKAATGSSKFIQGVTAAGTVVPYVVYDTGCTVIDSSSYTGNVTGLSIKQSVGNTFNPLEIRDSANALVFSVSPTGGVSAGLVRTASFQTGAVNSGIIPIPLDDTIPLNTEGDQYMSLTYTPKNAANKLVITASGIFSTALVNDVIMALFQDTTVNALKAVTSHIADATARIQLTISHTMIAGTNAATTFKIRAGPPITDTLTFNGSGGTRRLGGVMNSFIHIQETSV